MRVYHNYLSASRSYKPGTRRTTLRTDPRYVPPREVPAAEDAPQEQERETLLQNRMFAVTTVGNFTSWTTYYWTTRSNAMMPCAQSLLGDPCDDEIHGTWQWFESQFKKYSFPMSNNKNYCTFTLDVGRIESEPRRCYYVQVQVSYLQDQKTLHCSVYFSNFSWNVVVLHTFQNQL